VKVTYIPSREAPAEAAVAARRRANDSHVNNPSESLGQGAGCQPSAPALRLQPEAAAAKRKITATEGGASATEVEQGHREIAPYEQHAHGVAARQGSRRSGLILCRHNEEGAGHAEWKDYIEKSRRLTRPERREFGQNHKGTSSTSGQV